MARLSLYLPPLAGDYSGVCSTLFGLNCLVIIVDANCCTRNYVEYDEPRWARRRKTAFSAQLRTLEAVMGDDSRIIDQACEAVAELAPACVAIIGSPVPAIMGMDLAGMAMEIEGRTGVPSLGLPTTGFETYEQGVSMALDALVARFCVPGGAESPAGRPSQPAAGGRVDVSTAMASGQAGHGADVDPVPVPDPVGVPGRGVPAAGATTRPSVNVLGFSPHDFADEADMHHVREWLAEAGVDVAFCPDDTYALGDVAGATSADVSIVVAWSGLAAARRLREEHGIPFVVGRPLCATDAAELADGLRIAATAGEGLAGGAEGPAGASSLPGDVLAGAAPVLAGLLGELPSVAEIPAPPSGTGEPERAKKGCGSSSGPESPLLIVGEQLWANAVRGHARRLFARKAPATLAASLRPVISASLFAMDDALMEPGDLRLPDEGALQDFARAHPGFAWVGDPLLARIPELGAAPHLSVPHEALSSTLYERDRAALSGEGLLHALEGFIAELQG